MERGKLIVFEGLDRTGKSTQSQLLNKRLEKSFLIRFPNRETLIGKQIDGYLQGKQKLSDQAIHLLFSANRWECKDQIIDLLNQGINVIVDRYIYSGVAYSSAKGLDLQWCLNSDIGLPKPDILFYIQLNNQNQRQGFGDEIYENLTFQQKVKTQYEKMKNSQWTILEGDQSIDDLHQQIIKIVLDHKIQEQNIQKIE